MVPAPIAECFAVLEAVDRYPVWYPGGFRDVEVLARGPHGQPSTVRSRLHVSRGPLEREFDLELAILVERPTTVKLTRVTDDPSEQQFDVNWRLQHGQQGTRIDLQLYAKLRVSRLVPLGGVGNSLAAEFVAAAAKEIGSRS